jgi:hypothetical protein
VGQILFFIHTLQQEEEEGPEEHKLDQHIIVQSLEGLAGEEMDGLRLQELQELPDKDTREEMALMPAQTIPLAEAEAQLL